MSDYNIKTPAKINLTLDVRGIRSDSYHELESVVETVSIYDKLYISINIIPPDSKTDNNKIIITCSDNSIPCDENNIVYKAVQQYFNHIDKSNDILNNKYKISIDIEKNIPHCAGLGGGSSDAAAVLKVLNMHFNNHFSRGILFGIASKIGADVPMCLAGGCNIARGIGDKLTHICSGGVFHYVIAKSDISVSTPECYKILDNTDISAHPDTTAAAKAIEHGDYVTLAKNVCNVMETAAANIADKITLVKNTMLNTGALGSAMTGSGSAVFGIFGDKQSALSALENAALTDCGRLFYAHSCDGILIKEIPQT